MRDRIIGYLLFVTVCQTAMPRDTGLEITIELDDYSGLNASARRNARTTAEAILTKAGIGVQWQDCPVNPPKGAALVCSAGTSDVAHFDVAVLPESMSARIASNPQQFGMSLMGGRGGFPTQVYVFKDRVVEFAAAEQAPWATLVGTIIAHEIGHLLLGSESHFPAGIMRGRWRPQDVKDARMGVLVFTARQADQLRAGVRRRMNTKK